MSAPTSAAPLVVNTRDGMCWTRRSVTSSGIALYASEGVCACPEFVMATLAELAELGISGSADVLPVPVGPEPQALSVDPRVELIRRDRTHCEAEERRSWAKGSQPTSFDWIEDEEDGVAELVATVNGEQLDTGYTVTPLEVASAYDPDADE